MIDFERVWIFWKLKIKKNSLSHAGGVVRHTYGEYKKHALPSRFRFLIVRQFTLFTQFRIFWKFPQFNRHNWNNSENSIIYIFTLFYTILRILRIVWKIPPFMILFCFPVFNIYPIYIYYTIFCRLFQYSIFYILPYIFTIFPYIYILPILL
jgi:hypothetical protein